MSESGPAADVLLRITRSVRDRLATVAPQPGLAERAKEAAERRAEKGRRSLTGALAAGGVRVIAECKRRSPSAGWLRQPFDATVLARSYQAGGAAAISVVTEPEFFAGELAWLGEVGSAVSLPVVRKDFIVTERQLQETVLAGADAVLLIAGILPGGLLEDLLGIAGELALDTLLEVHDEAEVERVSRLAAPVVGINSRDLRTFRVDLDGALALAGRLPEDRVVVMESGIRGGADVARALAGGVRRFLVGEHLVRAADPTAALAELVACG